MQVSLPDAFTNSKGELGSNKMDLIGSSLSYEGINFAAHHNDWKIALLLYAFISN